jgi:hypothetical protein
MKQATRLLALWVLLFLAGCGAKPDQSSALPSPSPSPSPSPEKCFDFLARVVPCEPLERAVNNEMSGGSPEDSLEWRMHVRKMVSEYLQKEDPTWQIEGMALSRCEGDPDYSASVDVIADGKSRIIQLKVWLFIKGNGQTYWKVGAV